MDLLERATVFEDLSRSFKRMREGEGCCVLLTGEAGIGKTSVVRAFCEAEGAYAKVYQSSCDAFFSPRPLAPVYDIVSQLDTGLWKELAGQAERMEFFSSILQELGNQTSPVVLVLEDIHWADEATLDFIKYLGRRISRIRCLLLLTYRDNEIHTRHPLRAVLGQLPYHSFTRLALEPLSRPTVQQLARERGYNGEEVYQISGGNPFYVTEILASYSQGVPDNVKDSILSVYQRQHAETRRSWEWLSLFPTGIEISYFEKLESASLPAIEESLTAKILLLQNGVLFFKHELYRRTVEEAISPLLRITMNRQILETFRPAWEAEKELERIIHHAKNANEYSQVVHYAPLAADHAAVLGSHFEAAKLYYTAIEYNQDRDKNVLIRLYEAYAYECYLTNQIKDAIIYQGRALAIWKERNDANMIGNSLRFLSRLWWFDGNRKQAEFYAEEAIQILEPQPPSKIKAMAYSNFSQLNMLADRPGEAILWGEKAMAMARELGDEETVAHALNNIGVMRLRYRLSRDWGKQQLEESLSISLKHGFHEHVARAYTNMGSNGVDMKEYAYGRQALEAGIRYCEERDLKSWSTYMQCCLARLLLDTGHWQEAYPMAMALLNTDSITAITRIGALIIVGTINMRRGDDEVWVYLKEALKLSKQTQELQRLIPAMAAILEYEWLSQSECLESADLENVIRLMENERYATDHQEFVFWLLQTRNLQFSLQPYDEREHDQNQRAVVYPASWWAEKGCPYEEALLLFQGHERDKRKALEQILRLGGLATCERLKQEMRNAGIKSIPRGARKSTQNNPAQLTTRELDVLQLLQNDMQNKEIAARLFISAKTVDHHISSILFKLDVHSRAKAVQVARQKGILK